MCQFGNEDILATVDSCSDEEMEFENLEMCQFGNGKKSTKLIHVPKAKLKRIKKGN